MAGIIGGTGDVASTLSVVQDADREDGMLKTIAGKLDKLSKLALLVLLEMEARKNDLCMDCAQQYGKLGKVIRENFSEADAPTASSSTKEEVDADARRRDFQERLRNRRAGSSSEPSRVDILNTFEGKVAEQQKILKVLIQVLKDMANHNCKRCEEERNAPKPGDPTHLFYL